MLLFCLHHQLHTTALRTSSSPHSAGICAKANKWERPGIHFPDLWIQLEIPVWFMSAGEASSGFANRCYQ